MNIPNSLKGLQSLINVPSSFSSQDLAWVIGYWARQVSKSHRRNCQEDIPIFLTKLLLTTLALCNSLGLDATNSLIVKYPGVCAWCGNVPCECATGKKRGKKTDGIGEVKVVSEPLLSVRFDTLDHLQAMCHSIYPSTTLGQICAHCLEEALEVIEAVHIYPEEQQSEIADLLERIFDVAQALSRSLFEILTEHFTQEFYLVPKS